MGAKALLLALVVGCSVAFAGLVILDKAGRGPCAGVVAARALAGAAAKASGQASLNKIVPASICASAAPGSLDDKDFRQNIVFSFGAGLLAAVVTAMVISGSSEPKTPADALREWMAADVDDLRKQLTMLFKNLDTQGDGNGFLSREDLQAGLADPSDDLASRLRAAGVKDLFLFEQMDVNHDGKVDLNEFLNTFSRQAALAQIFHEADTNNDRSLSMAELKAGAKTIHNLKAKLQRAGLTPQQLFTRLDTDGNKKVTLGEFLEAFAETKKNM